jgi:hypothetical protein
MTKSKEQLRQEYLHLMRRANAIGSLLPAANDVDVDDPCAMAGVLVILREYDRAIDQLARVSVKINRLPH